MNMRKIAVATTLFSLVSCSSRVEGQLAGDCSDEADNDLNGFFDCADPSCMYSPACETDENGPKGNDNADNNTDDTDDPTDTAHPEDTATGVRDSGPLPSEYNLVTAWNILTTTGITDMSTECVDTEGDWSPLFAAPEYGSGYYYVFYEVQASGQVAEAMACGSNYPDDCSEKGFSYAVSGHEVSKQDLDVQDLGNGCALDIGQNVRILDQGEFGQLVFEVHVDYGGTCYSADINNGCSVMHTYDLDFTAAR